jgi:predicted DNA binding CopG/RHH family protein
MPEKQSDLTENEEEKGQKLNDKEGEGFQFKKYTFTMLHKEQPAHNVWRN